MLHLLKHAACNIHAMQHADRLTCDRSVRCVRMRVRCLLLVYYNNVSASIMLRSQLAVWLMCYRALATALEM
jgi:hypothetical protein